VRLRAGLNDVPLAADDPADTETPSLEAQAPKGWSLSRRTRRQLPFPNLEVGRSRLSPSGAICGSWTYS